MAVTFTSAGDFKAIRQSILDSTLNAVAENFPYENEQYILGIEDLGYDNFKGYSRSEQKKAVQADATLSARLKGRWTLTDKATGKTIRGNRRGIMDVPWLTERGTFIRRGSEVTLPIQMRLVPGVYVRTGEDGVAGAHINVRPGTGNTVKMAMDPAKPIFKVSVGNRNYKLYPLLKHLGVDDRALKEYWGDKIWKVNHDDFLTSGGWYGSKGKEEGANGEQYEKIAADVLGGELDEVSTGLSFGTPYTKVDGKLLAHTSHKLLRLAKGEIESDNRDSLENQRFFGAADLVSERVRLDAKNVARNLLWKVTRNGDIDKIPGGVLSQYIHSLFTESNLAQVIEETNPLDAYARATKVTRMGEGGIGSIDSAPMSSRMVHNTYKGFIDPVATPESLRVGLDTQIAINAQYGSDGLMYSPFIDGATGKTVMVDSITSSTVPVTFPEYMNSKQRIIPAMVGNDIVYLPKSQVKYFVPDGDSLFSLASNFVPLKQGIKAGRLLMAQKHQTQAMSLPEREAPFVQTIAPGGKGESIESKYGELLGAVKSETSGTVVKVTPDEITVRSVDGELVTHSLYNTYPLNRKTMIHNTPVVAKGDEVKAGQLLAPSNYTDKDGTASLGRQLTIAWLPIKGYNYLDGIAISESGAKKLTSEHLYKTATDKREGLNIDKRAFIGAYPTKYTREQTNKLDESGVIKVGETLTQGDPMVLALENRPPTFGSKARGWAKDLSEVWPYTYPGVVADVINTDKGVKIYTRAEVPAAVGDKLACFDKATEILTSDGWVYFPELTEAHKVADYDHTKGTFTYSTPTKLMDFRWPDEMYRYKTNKLDIMVTNNHELLIKDTPDGRLYKETAERLNDRKAYVTKTAEYTTDYQELVTVPLSCGERLIPTDVYILTAAYAYRERFILRKPITNSGDKLEAVANTITERLQGTGATYAALDSYFARMGRLPSELSKFPADIIIQFFNHLFEHDVYHSADATVVIAKVKADADFLQILALHAGMAADISPARKGYKVTFYPPTIATAVPTKPHFWSKPKIYAPDTSRRVYCCTVPGGSIYVRRNGKAAWCGNCRFANKGTVGIVIPDDQMPRTQDGKVIDIAFGPTGIASRVNSAQLIEAALGKVAEKTGKRYVLPGFMDDNLIEFAKKELADAGLSAKEDLVDPETGLLIPQVMVGSSYVTKFHHTSESKVGARSTGAYTSDEQPGTGGYSGAKTLGGLLAGAFVGHSTTGVLEDLKLIKGQKNTDFWRAFKMGETPARPKTPLIYERFLAHLEGSGVKVTKTGDNTNIFALTDKDISKFARAPLQNTDTYNAATLRPLQGGLFDPAIFGKDGDQWAYIDLDEPIPNPIMEDPLRSFLNLTGAELEQVLAGTKKLPNGLTGGAGLYKALESLNVDSMLTSTRNTILHGTKSGRDKAIKQYRWLQSLKQHGAHPSDFMLTKIPVLPPRFRRITENDGMAMVADANYLYKALFEARDDLREAAAAKLPEDMLGMGRVNIYKSYKALTGLGDPISRELKEKDLTGLLTWVFGKGSPKCHDTKTSILTEEGFIPVAEYKGDVKCAYVDVASGATDIKFEYPGKVRHTNYKGNMVSFRGKGLNLMVTPWHRCLVAYTDTTDIRKFHFVKASHLIEANLPFYMKVTTAESDTTDKNRLIKPYEMRLVKYKGLVHSVTVPLGITIVRKGNCISVTGNSGKFQKHVVGGTVDVTGRGVINVDPELELDEIGLPINQAWDLYRDFIIRKLVQSGASVLQATKEATEKTKAAEGALRQIIAERPLIVTRAPALHKYSVMAFRPKLVDGHSILLNAVVEDPFNADLDGDSMLGLIQCYIKRENVKELLDNPYTDSKVTCRPINIKEASMLSASEKISIIDTVMAIEDVPIVKGTEVQLDERKTEWDVEPGIFVDALDRETGQKGIYPVTKKSLHKDTPMWDVTIGQPNNFPKVITCSEDRSLVTYWEGNIVTSTPEESKGRMVPMIVPDGSADPDLCMRWADWGTKVPLTRETGELIGIVLGDGWIDSQNQVRVASQYKELQEFIVGVTSKYFSCTKGPAITSFHGDENSRWGNPVSERVNLHLNKKTTVTLRERIGNTAYNKRIPWECLRGCKAHLEGLLAGLLETDGSLNYSELKGGKINRGISYDTTSPYLRDGVTALCTKLGIRTSVLVYRSTHSTTDCYRVSLSVTDFTEFYKDSGRFKLHQQEKQDRLDNIVSVEGSLVADGKADRVPYPTHLLNEFSWAKLSVPATEKVRWAKMNSLPRQQALQIVAELKECDWDTYAQPIHITKAKRTDRSAEEAKKLVNDWCDMVENRELKWEPITKIDYKGRMDAWDITVPGPLTFATSDGIIVQDTMTYHVPVSDRAVKEAYEKMLPSKNLLSARDYTAHYLPQEEFNLGIFLASRDGKGPVKKVFNTKQEAILAYKRGEIDLNDNIQVLGK